MADNKANSAEVDAARARGSDAPSGDALGVADVLTDAQADPCNITSNLQFHYDSSSGNTLVEVTSPDGAGAGVQQIVLQGVDLTSGGSLNDSQVIQLLLAQGKSFD